MIPVSLRFPGGRELRSLWQEFAGLSPTSLHLAHLLLHHVDAPVAVRARVQLAPLETAVLEASKLTEPASAVEVDSLVCLGAGLTAQLLERLRECGLVEADTPNRWRTTALGRQAAGGAIDGLVRTRRDFHFADSCTGMPRFVVPPRDAAAPLNDPGEWRFDSRTLAECIARDEAWKREHGFPADVARLDEHAGGRVNCAGVIVDRAESLPLALVAATRMSIAFLDVRTWKPLAASRPEYANPEEACAALGIEFADAANEAGRAAWLEWAGRRGLAERDAAGCAVQVAGARLEVKAPRTLVNRLQHGSSPEGEFLLVGSGLVRRMLRIELRADR